MKRISVLSIKNLIRNIVSALDNSICVMVVEEYEDKTPTSPGDGDSGNSGGDGGSTPPGGGGTNPPKECLPLKWHTKSSAMATYAAGFDPVARGLVTYFDVDNTASPMTYKCPNLPDYLGYLEANMSVAQDNIDFEFVPDIVNFQGVPKIYVIRLCVRDMGDLLTDIYHQSPIIGKVYVSWTDGVPLVRFVSQKLWIEQDISSNPRLRFKKIDNNFHIAWGDKPLMNHGIGDYPRLSIASINSKNIGDDLRQGQVPGAITIDRICNGTEFTADLGTQPWNAFHEEYLPNPNFPDNRWFVFPWSKDDGSPQYHAPVPQLVDSDTLELTTGEWFSGVTNGTERAAVMGVQYIQSKFIYRVHFPEDRVGYKLGLGTNGQGWSQNWLRHNQDGQVEVVDVQNLGKDYENNYVPLIDLENNIVTLYSGFQPWANFEIPADCTFVDVMFERNPNFPAPNTVSIANASSTIRNAVTTQHYMTALCARLIRLTTDGSITGPLPALRIEKIPQWRSVFSNISGPETVI